MTSASPPDSALAERVGKIENAIGDVTAALVGLTEAVGRMQAREGKLPIAQSPERVLREVNQESAGRLAAAHPGQLTGSSRTVHLLNPRAHLTGFMPNDVVRLRPESIHYPQVNPPAEVLGVVLKFQRVSKGGQRKYTVHFDGIGRDGVEESDLELVQSAV